MKKIIPALALSCILFACNKQTDSQEEQTVETKKPITFSLNGFLTSQEPMGRVAPDTSLDRIAHIYCMAYTSDGAQVKYIHQDTVRNKSDFGIITDSLAPGTYTVVLAASTRLVDSTQIYGGRLSWHGLTPQNFGNSPAQLGDVFFKKMQVVVTSSTDPQNMDVVLDRITGQLRVEALDALPDTHPNGTVRIELLGFARFFNLGTSTVSAPSPTTQYFGSRVNQTTFIEYVLGSNYGFYVYLTYKDKTTGAAKGKIFDNVKVETNKKTIIRGYLYGAPDANRGDFNIKVNQAWSGDSTVTNF